MPRRHFLIVFADEWAAYSGPLQNLVRLLSRHDVQVLCVDCGEFRTDGLASPPFEIVRVPNPLAVNAWRSPGGSGKSHLWARKVRKALQRNLRAHERVDLYTALKVERLVRRLVGRRADRVVAMDPVAALASSFVFDRFTFWPVEFKNRHLLELFPPERIARVVVQTPARYGYFFGSTPHETWYVQNAPFFEGEVSRSEMRQARRIVYFGNAGHARRFFAPLLRHLPAHTLTLAGFWPGDDRPYIEAQGADLVNEGRLIFEKEYAPPDRVIEYLRGHSIGLALFDIDRVRRECRRHQRAMIDDYLTAPAGKVFHYFAAGLPVVGNRLPGLAPVEEYGAGILVSETPTPEEVAEAILALERDYDRYVEGAFRAARANDFRTLAAPLLERWENEPPARTRPRGTVGDIVRAARFFATLTRGVQPTEREEIERLARTLGRRPVVAYGAGDILDFLFAEGGLGRLSIVAVADSSPAKHGTTVRGLPVIAPERIPEYARDVVVTSYEHEAEIAATVERLHGGAVVVHKIYPSAA